MSKEVRIAILAIAAAAILLFGYKFIIGKSILSKKQLFYIKYKDIDQLQVANPVMVNGFEVGIVNKIFLDKDNVTPVVEIEVKPNINVPKDAIAYLASLGVMGGKAIQLKISGACTDCAHSGDFLRGESKSLLSGFVSEGEIENYTEKLKHSALSIMDTLTGEHGKKEIKDGIKNLEKTLHNLAQSTTLLNNLLLKNSKKIDNLVTNLESVVSNIQSSNKEISSILSNFDTISSQIRKAGVSHTIEEFNSTLQEGKKAIVELKNTMVTAEKAIISVNTLMKKAESGEGSAAKILNDPALYNNLSKTSKQLELLLQDLRLNPKRYVNVSVFGKKQKEFVPIDEDPALQQDSILQAKEIKNQK